ncbi:MAG: hypothetical protein LBD59_05610 [Prevotellaceae bacterium]|jgi:hypothetical protein|nr:hypothetical protein [Prevotellaceae bacterium]
MKRESIFLTIGIAVVAITLTVAGINYNLVSIVKSNESNLTLENIEAYTSEGEAGGVGSPNCYTTDSGIQDCNFPNTINGVTSIVVKKRVWNCFNNGSKRKCSTGLIFWDANNNEVKNTYEKDIACPW